jgi:hypothetical protein
MALFASQQKICAITRQRDPRVLIIAGTVEGSQNHARFLLEGTMAKPNLSRMVEQLKKGKKIDDFLIDKSARKGRKKRKSRS